MADVVIDISVSVDGFVTGPDAGPGRGLGVGGEALHTWAFEGDEVDKRVLDSAAAATGAVLMGRRTFDVVDAPDGWSGDLGYGAERDQSAAPPNFVVTHAVPGAVRLSDRFTFVTTGVADAVAQARAGRRGQAGLHHGRRGARPGGVTAEPCRRTPAAPGADPAGRRDPAVRPDQRLSRPAGAGCRGAH